MTILIRTPATARRLYPRARRSVPPNALQLLAALYAEPTAEVSDLSRDLALAKSAVSEALADLLHRELVTKRPMATDRRRSEYELTDSGVAEAHALIQHAREALDEPGER